MQSDSIDTPRHALARDLPELTLVMANAFFEDPALSWLFEDPEKRPHKIGRMLGFALETGLRRGHVYTLENRRAVAVWSPPDVPLFGGQSAKDQGAMMQELVGPGEGLSRLRALGQMRGHPPEPHFYLYGLGTHPEFQGRGLGVRVIEPVLTTCDRERLPAYLESANPRNHSFYERLGFRVVDELVIPDGPTITSMWREPR